MFGMLAQINIISSLKTIFDLIMQMSELRCPCSHVDAPDPHPQQADTVLLDQRRTVEDQEDY